MSFDILGLGIGPSHPALSGGQPPVEQFEPAPASPSSDSAGARNSSKLKKKKKSKEKSREEKSKPKKSKSSKKPKQRLASHSDSQSTSGSAAEDSEPAELGVDEFLDSPSGESDSDGAADSVRWSEIPSVDDPIDFTSGLKRSLDALSFDRFDWLQRQLELRDRDYLEEKRLKFFVGTYNLNGKKCKSEESLDKWINHGIEEFGAADVYCIGFQEIVDLNAQSLFVDHSAAEPWESLIDRTLSNTGARFIQIASIHLVGLSMCVYVRESHLSHVSDVRSSSVGVGIMGVGGNKGAVVVRFNLYRSSVCFVNAHLAAHQKNFKARNSDYHNILRKCALAPKNADRRTIQYRDTTNRRKMKQTHVVLDEDGDRESGDEESTSAAAVKPAKSKMMSDLENVKTSMWAGFNALKNKLADQLDIQSLASKSGPGSAGAAEIPDNSLTIYDHDHIIWLGDLNYRLDVQELGLDLTCNMIANKNWKTILGYDQLLAQKREKNAFVGFNEGKIEFAPTYKYIPGTDNYDRREDKKVRLPAYTDRIQWCSNEEESVKLHYYNSAPLKLSDHKPVMALIEFPIKAEIEKKKNAIKNQLESFTDKQCQSVKMEFSVSQLEVSDPIRFDFPVSLKFAARNSSRAVLSVKLAIAESDSLSGVEKQLDSASLDWPADGELADDEKNLFEETPIRSNYSNQKLNGASGNGNGWITIEPSEFVIHPGSHHNISTTILIDRRFAQQFNLRPDEFPSIALRLDNGKRVLLPIKARYLKSTLGSTLPHLIQLTAPIRGSTFAADAVLDYYSKSFTKKTGIPMELFRLIERVSQHSKQFKVKNIWNSPAFAEKNKKNNGAAKKESAAGNWDFSRMIGTPQVRYLCECLDSGRNFDNVPNGEKLAGEAASGLNARAGEVDLRVTLVRLEVKFFVAALCYWLNSLQRPVFFIPTDSSSALSPSPLSSGLAPPDLVGWCSQAALDVPADHYRVFQYLMTFFRQILTEKQENGVSTEILTDCFTAPLFHRPPKRSFNTKIPWTPAEILKVFIENLSF